MVEADTKAIQQNEYVSDDIKVFGFWIYLMTDLLIFSVARGWRVHVF